MGWLFKSKAEKDMEHHEKVHGRAYRGNGLGTKVVDRKGTPVIQTSIGGSKRQKKAAAIGLMAGAMAGGGDSRKDRKAAEDLAREAGVPIGEIKRKARKYL